jgi:hypothetical protein
MKELKSYIYMLLEQIDAPTAITINYLRKDDSKSLGIELTEDKDKYQIIDLDDNTGNVGWHIVMFKNKYYATDFMDEIRAEAKDINELLDAVEEYRIKHAGEFS